MFRRLKTATSALALAVGMVSAAHADDRIFNWFPNHFLHGSLNASYGQELYPCFGKAPWEARYSYVNNGWETWNTTPYGNGSFIPVYDNQWLPDIEVFSWYVIGSGIDSNNYPVDTIAHRLATIDNNTAMASYWAQVTLAFQQTINGAYDDEAFPIVVFDIEPDTFGFIQQNAVTNPGPNTGPNQPVSVAASGNADLATLPNTAAGMAQAYVLLRNKYAAPNVLLGWHQSWWGSELWTPTSEAGGPSGTPGNAGTANATFYNAMGAAFDLMIGDTSDADRDYKELVPYNGNPVQDANMATWTTASWNQYGTMLHSLWTRTGLYQLLWQVPLGNTVKPIENDTSFHYQSTEPQHIFAGSPTYTYMQGLANNGVLGILWGRGQSTDTDSCMDDVTNMSGLEDDGNYLNGHVSAYYTAGAPVTETLTVPPP